MIDSRMIERIVREVLNKLEMEPVRTKPELHVISKNIHDQSTEICKLSAYWNVVHVDLTGSLSSTEVQQAVFLHLDQDTLARIALGFSDTPESKLFAQLISEEVGILVVLDPLLEKLLQADVSGHRYPEYVKKIRGYKESVEKFGVSFKRLEELKPIELNPTNDTKQTQGAKKLITQEDIENYWGDQMILKQGTIITPLAKDKARERGIEISFSRN